jgi:hypothetical protein
VPSFAICQPLVSRVVRDSVVRDSVVRDSVVLVRSSS